MEDFETVKKVTVVVPVQHLWTKRIRGLSAVIEYLLDQHFGTEYSDDPEENEILIAKKVIKAQKIIENMRQQRQEEKQEAKKILLSRKFKKPQKITDLDDTSK